MQSDGLSTATLDHFDRYRSLVSRQLRELFDRVGNGVYDLCRYHLGWADETGAAIDAGAGKMLRPIFCLVACGGYGAPEQGVGVAAALELLHAFSLVHDDIEDDDRERHHRPTVWAQFGVPLAINAGDALFGLAHRALYAGVADLPVERAALARRLFSDATLRLIEGQHLDIEFEARVSVSPAEYGAMVRGKTGAVMGASLGLGALCGGGATAEIERLCDAGRELGIAFQAVDDGLGFWGDPALTGKAIGNDLRRGKKSLPMVLAAERGIDIGGLGAAPLHEVQRELEEAGIRDAVEAFATAHRTTAESLIQSAGMSTAACRQLLELTAFSVSRVS